MLQTSEDDPVLTLHWWGNMNVIELDRVSKVKWYPCWFQPRNAKIYYKGGKEVGQHVAYTNLLTEETIHESDIICYDLKLKGNWTMRAESADRCLIAIDQVIQDLPDSGGGVNFNSL